MGERLAARLREHQDIGLAVLLGSLLAIQVWLADFDGVRRGAATAGCVLIVVALARRTSSPLALVGVLLAGLTAAGLVDHRLLDFEAIGPIVLLTIYNAAAHTAGRRTILAGIAVGVMGIVTITTDRDGVAVGAVIYFTVLFGAPWAAGRVVRRRRLNESRLERERDAAQAAIGAERARIARELHDVIAHAISVVVLQARGGRRLLDTDPAETRGALLTIERTGQQALVEMRRLVGLLRADDDAVALAPQPSLARLDTLVGQVRAAGLPVEVAVEGVPVDLPPGVDLSAFRIIQEALTNALKHAGPATTRVLVRYEPEGLWIDVSDDGAHVSVQRAGHGLIGIRERVALHGGDIQVGPRDQGGYSVRVRLPLGATR